MYIYRMGTEDFGTLIFIPQEFYKFWNGEIDNTAVSTYTKPLDPLPVIDWEINLTAEDWRSRVAYADPQNIIPISKLREIPDSYIEAVMLNILYGYNMNYFNSKAMYMPSRIGYSFTMEALAYPSLAIAMLGLKTLIQEYVQQDNTVSLARADTLRSLLRHITYVAVVIVRVFEKVEPNGEIFISSLKSLNGKGRDTIYYDRAAMDAWIAKGGSEPLAAADWAIHNHTPDDSTIENAIPLLSQWKTLTDLTT